MNASPLWQLGLYLIVLLTLAWALGRYLAIVLDGRLSARCAWLGRFERGLCRLIGSDPDEDMPWWRYATAILLFNIVGVLAVVRRAAPAGCSAAQPCLA
ncbi:potassium-transporting ATPase subunit KdpA [Pseudogulbenkiania ferrooxidans]|uniref:Potassium-transporting ATPase subunit A n=1 Tax=Pseudogulbenkiania ferrooxidans 2002 TaxID=279714 RepID=B9Z386_9NEIS|nr:potassium-transporting ATPase subunit KdpA [Pseudogulbenkiania ferrooxidans]EEG09039.1 potassium-transporting ATPase subunit A [Pseudogulbenkiania ferrooxidans 2002]